MIRITPKAKEWLDQKGYTQLTMDVKVAKVETCCSSQVVYTDLKPGKPNQPDQYCETLIDHIVFYYPSRIKLPKDRDVMIELRSTLGIKRLQVKGLTRDEHLL